MMRRGRTVNCRKRVELRGSTAESGVDVTAEQPGSRSVPEHSLARALFLLRPRGNAHAKPKKNWPQPAETKMYKT